MKRYSEAFMSKSDICIITSRNIFNSPCLEKYEKIIENDFDILYWDRCNIEESCGAKKYYKYNKELKANVSIVEKAIPYFGFFKYVVNFLRKEQYKKLIIFPTQMAWLMLPWLKGKYKSKYVLDIRDYSGEFGIRGKLTDLAVKNAGMVTITSPAYKNFLPKGEYCVSHNIQEIDSALVNSYRQREKKDSPIVLSFIGSVRFIEQQIRLIEKFKNDNRFILKFIGRGSEQLEAYCKKNNIENVQLIGRFERNDLSKYYLETDIAINVYGNKTPVLDYALSNKLYSAAIMGMPILVSPDTFMSEISCKYGFGIEVDLNDDFVADKVFECYTNLKKNVLFKGCDDFMKSVYEDESSYKESLKLFLDK